MERRLDDSVEVTLRCVGGWQEQALRRVRLLILCNTRNVLERAPNQPRRTRNRIVS